MPRLYKVGNDRKWGPSSRVSRTAAHQVTSSSSMPVSAVEVAVSSSAVAASSSASVANKKCAHSDISGTDFHQFDYNAFDYGDDFIHDTDTGFIGSNKQSLQSSAGCEARTSSLLPSNECRGNNVGAAASSATSSNSSLVYDEIKTAKSNNNKQKRMSISTASMKPTVASPRITHSDLAKNNSASSNNSTTSKRDNSCNSKKPMGNPISKSSKNGKTTKKKKKNDENTESHHNLLRESISTCNDEDSVDSGAEDPQPTTKKQQQQKKQRGKRQVSFSGETNGGKSNNKNNAMSTSEWEVDDWEACLQDTDDDNSSIGKHNVKSLPEEKTKSVSKTKSRGGVKKKARTNSNSTVAQNKARKDAVQQQQQQRECQTKIQILPQRILAIDNRVIPTVVGDSIARSSFLRYIPQLVLGGFEKGILQACVSNDAAADASIHSTILASFVHGTMSSEQSEEHVGKKRAAGELAYTSIVPRVSFLFDRRDRLGGDVATAMTNNEQSIWLTEFISPVSNSFGNPMANTDFDRRGNYCDGFAAEDSWSYFGDLGELQFSNASEDVTFR